MSSHIKHLLIAALIAAVVLGVTWKLIASSDQQAHDRNVIAQEQLKHDQSAEKAALVQAQTDRAASDAIISQKDAQISVLIGQNRQLMAALSARQAQDSTLPLPELGQRLETLVGAIPGDVKPLPDGLSLNTSASRKTVILLEEVPADREKIANQDQIIAATGAKLTSVQTALGSAETALEACQKTQVSADAACKAQIDEVKANARKRNVILSVLAAIGGFILRSKI